MYNFLQKVYRQLLERYQIRPTDQAINKIKRIQFESPMKCVEHKHWHHKQNVCANYSLQ